MYTSDTTSPVILAVSTEKGGSGKTTTAHSLAAGLAMAGVRVLCLDLDGQCNLSRWLQTAPSPTLAEVMRDEGLTLPAVVQTSRIEGVDVIPAGRDLGAGVVALRSRPGAELWLRRHLRLLPPDRWDVVILDSPPTADNLMTVSAIAAARWVLSPCRPAGMDAGGAVNVVGHVATIGQALDSGADLLGLCLCAVEQTREARDIRALLREGLASVGARLLSSEIRKDARVIEAPSRGVSIFEHAPKCRAAADYRALVVEVANLAGIPIPGQGDGHHG